MYELRPLFHSDCMDSVRFLAKHAEEYGIDPNRIGTFGSSAGGHLTLMTALGDRREFACDSKLDGPPVKIRCVAAYFPLVSFIDPDLIKGSNFENPQRLIPILGGPIEKNRDLAKKLSPIELIRADSPPIFLAHGDSDHVLSYRNSERMRDVAKAKGVPVECIISKGSDHGFSGNAIEPNAIEINKRTVEFFAKHLIE